MVKDLGINLNSVSRNSCYNFVVEYMHFSLLAASSSLCTPSRNCIQPRTATLLPQNHTVAHINFFGVPNLKQTGSYRYKFRYNLCLTTSHLTQPGLSPAANGNHIAPDVLTCTDDGVF